MRFVLLLVFLFICGGGLSAHAGSEKSILNGSSTVAGAMILPFQHQIESQVGHEVEYYTTSSGRGLQALLDGQADIAMVSFSEDDLAKRPELKDSKIKVAQLDYHFFGEAEIQLIVSRDSPIHSVSLQELQQIMLGDVTNWDALGIPELGPIRLITGHPSAGTYATTEKALLNGQKINQDKVTILQSSLQVPVVVSQLNNAIGLLSSAIPDTMRTGTRVIKIDGIKIQQPLGLITYKNDHTEATHHMIEIIKKLTRHMRIDTPKQ